MYELKKLISLCIFRRLADQREKEEFEERLRLKDEARTRKIAEAKLTKEELQVSKRLLTSWTCRHQDP